MVLPDQAAKDIDPAWFEEGESIRVADAFVVDIMLNACGETYETLQQYAETVDLDGLPIHTINLEGLLLTKRSWSLMPPLMMKPARRRPACGPNLCQGIRPASGPPTRTGRWFHANRPCVTRISPTASFWNERCRRSGNTPTTGDLIPAQ